MLFVHRGGFYTICVWNVIKCCLCPHIMCTHIQTHLSSRATSDGFKIKYLWCADSLLTSFPKVWVRQIETTTTLYPAVMSQHFSKNKLTYESKHCIRSHQSVSHLWLLNRKYKSPLYYLYLFDDSFCSLEHALQF